MPFAPVIPAALAPPREAPAPARALATRAPAPAAPFARLALGADQAPRGAEETLGTFHFSANPENPHPRAGGVVGGARAFHPRRRLRSPSHAPERPRGGPRFELPGELAARLYDHQRDGVRWMWNLQLRSRGGILADDMGLGKTLQVAAFARGYSAAERRRVLVLAPTTLLPHWGKEFVVCGLKEGVNLHKYTGSGSKSDRDATLRAVATRGGVLLTTYGMVTHNSASLGEPESEEAAEKVAAASGRGAAVSGQDIPAGSKDMLWDWIVCDEGHKLKNPSAQLPQKVRTLPSLHRLIITGTPIQNHLAELWALYDLCCPGLLGDEVEFRREYAKKIAAGQSRDATERQRSAGARASIELRRACGPLMLRREGRGVTRARGTKPRPRRKGNRLRGRSEGPRRTSRGPRRRGPRRRNRPRRRRRILGGRPGRRSTRPRSRDEERSHRVAASCPRNADCTARSSRAVPVRAALNKTGSALPQSTCSRRRDHPALRSAGADHRRGGRHRARRRVHVLGLALEDATKEEADPEEEEEDKSTAARRRRRGCRRRLTEPILKARPSLGKAGFLMDPPPPRRQRSPHAGVQSVEMHAGRARRAARADGHELVRIDGQVPPEERHARVERFQSDPDIPLALLTS